MATITINGDVHGDVAETINKGMPVRLEIPAEVVSELEKLGDLARPAENSWRAVESAIQEKSANPSVVKSLISFLIRHFPAVAKVALMLWAPHLSGLGIAIEPFLDILAKELDDDNR